MEIEMATEKDPLFFHIRPSLEDPKHPIDPEIAAQMKDHTYCVDRKNGNELIIGYAIVEEDDTFVKKTGRKIAADKAGRLKNIPDIGFSREVVRLPFSIEKTFGDIIAKAAKIMKIQGEVKIKTFANKHGKRTPVLDTIIVK